ncbi:MAG: hypothetical protein ACE367_09035 [Acidimicrobiales bacterium]
MRPSLAVAAVRGRPDSLDDLARTAGEVGGRWRARSVLLLDAMEAAAMADLRGLHVETAPARRLQAIGTQLVDAGHAIGAFSRALGEVDHFVDRHGVTTASQATVARWLLANRNDTTDRAIVEILQRLPDGQRRSLEDFEQLSASERMAWMDAFVFTSGDPHHRAITSVLAYLADSPTIRGDDRSVFSNSWWSVADAAVLLVIQDGWLRHQGITTPPGPGGVTDLRAAAYDDAVDAWADHVAALEAGELSDDETLLSWIRAEQAGVVFGEITVAHAWRSDPSFVPPTAAEWEAITTLVPGTHSYRLTVLAGTDREYLLAIVDDVIAHSVDAAIDLTAGVPLAPGPGSLPAGLLEDGGRSIAELGGGWTDNWGFGAATNVVGGALGGVGTAHRVTVETTTAAVDFVATGAAQAVAAGVEQLTPDELEREIARGLRDPTIVPPELLRQSFDLMLGTERADEELSFAYYFPMLVEAGLLPPLPDYWIDEDGRRRYVPPPVQAGPLRDD